MANPQNQFDKLYNNDNLVCFFKAGAGEGGKEQEKENGKKKPDPGCTGDLFGINTGNAEGVGR